MSRSEKSLRARGESRFPGYAIDHAATATPAKSHRVWSLQRFDAIDVVEVTIILNVVADSVEEKVCAGRVAADHQLVAIVLSLMRCNSGNVVHHIGNALHRLIADL